MIKNAYNIYYNELIHNHRKVAPSKAYGIVDGELGIVLYEMYQYEINQKEERLQNFFYYLNMSIDKCKNDCTLGYGLAGIAWIVKLAMRNALLEKDTEEWLREADKVLEKEYFLMKEQDNIDYFHGAAGIVFYFLNRASNKNTLIGDFIDYLHYKLNNGNWFKLTVHLDGNITNCINLGVPHGMTGLLLLILQIYESNKFDVIELIHKLATKLLGYKIEGESYFFL